KAVALPSTTRGLSTPCCATPDPCMRTGSRRRPRPSDASLRRLFTPLLFPESLLEERVPSVVEIPRQRRLRRCSTGSHSSCRIRKPCASDRRFWGVHREHCL